MKTEGARQKGASNKIYSGMAPADGEHPCGGTAASGGRVTPGRGGGSFCETVPRSSRQSIHLIIRFPVRKLDQSNKIMLFIIQQYVTVSAGVLNHHLVDFVGEHREC